MRRTRAVCVTAMFLLGMFTVAPHAAEATDIYYWTKHTPNMDAYVRRDMPTTNYGAPGLGLETEDDDRIIYLCWNLTGITATATMVLGQLWLYNIDDASHAPQPFSVVCSSGSNWTEGGITWNNRPIIAQNSVSMLGTLDENYTDHEWAICNNDTLATKAQIAFDGTGRLDLAINWTSSTPHQRQYIGAENALTEFRPALWLYWYVAGPTVYYWTYNIYPEADATVSEEEPSSNFGLETVLELRDDPFEKEVYLRFDLGLLPADANITGVSLWMFKESDEVGTGTLSVCYHYLYYNFDPNWSETEIDWYDRPREGALPITTMDDGTSKHGWVSASGNPLTTLATIQYNDSGHVYLSLMAEFQNDDGQRVYSSEEAGDGFKPYLSVTFWSGTHEYPQPDYPDDVPFIEDVGGLIKKVMAIVGFAGMIAVPSLMIWWYKREGEGAIESFINAVILWTVCFALFCTSIVWA